MVALSLLMARPIRDDEYPQQVEQLVASACARATDGTSEPLPSPVREWLRRTLQLDARNSFRSAFDAQAAFGQVVSQMRNDHADPEMPEHGSCSGITAIAEPAQSQRRRLPTFRLEAVRARPCRCRTTAIAVETFDEALRKPMTKRTS